MAQREVLHTYHAPDFMSGVPVFVSIIQDMLFDQLDLVARGLVFLHHIKLQ